MGIIRCVLPDINQAWMIFVLTGYRSQKMIISSFHRKRHFGRLKTTRTFNSVYIMLIKTFSKCPIISDHRFTIQENNVIIFKTPLFVRKDFIVLQNCLFVIIPLLYILKKFCVIDFLLSETHLFRCFLQDFSFCLVEFLKHLFLSILLVQITSLSSLFINGASFPLRIFFLRGACILTIFEKTIVRTKQFLSGLLALLEKSASLTSLRNFSSLKFL